VRLFRPPAVVQIRRAHLVLMLAGLAPTVLMSAMGIVLLALSPGTESVVAGVLVLALATSAVTGYILGSIFLNRGAAIARFQNDYLSAVSHELNTPITSTRMFIETLRERELPPEEKQKCLDLLYQEMERLDGLVQRLFELIRMESGRHQFERKPVLVDDLIEDAVSTFDVATLAEPTVIERAVEPGLVIVGDHSALSRAISNLLTNAWKYSPRGQVRIRIEARAEGKWVRISIADQGPGIDRAEQGRIFEMFERGQEAVRSGTSGSGLGLAIARAILRGNRGKIELHSEPGKGTRFDLRLRRVESTEAH
jgi:signal transduction histidine kinase